MNSYLIDFLPCEINGCTGIPIMFQSLEYLSLESSLAVISASVFVSLFVLNCGF